MPFAGHDIETGYIVGQSLAPQTITSDTNGSGVDCRDGSAEVSVVGLCSSIGSEEDTTVTYELEESDDNTTFTNITQADGSTAEAATALSGSVAAPALKTSYRRTKRYVRVVANVAGTSVSQIVAAAVVCKKASF